MNLMIDIGGGTTDISFFTMEKEKETDKNAKPQIYELLSAPIGLNFLTKAEEHLDSGKVDSNVDSNTKLDWVRQTEYTDEISNLCYRLRQRIIKLYDNSTNLNRERVIEALKDRLIIYTGGGSTFPTLRRAYGSFTDIKHITTREWGTQSFDEMEDISRLCPILSTVFGLSISATTDKFKTKPLNELFKHIEDAEEDAYDNTSSDPRSKSYKYNWLYKDYGELGASYNYAPSKKKLKAPLFPDMPPKTYNNNVVNNRSVIVQEKIDTTSAKLPKGNVSIETIPFSDVEKVGLASKRGVFTLSNHSKITCDYYGKIIICAGQAYDIYYDNLMNLIIDALSFEGSKCQRKTILAVSSSTALFKAIKENGFNRIKNIVKSNKTKKKKKRTTIRITINVSGSKYPQGSSITYAATYSNE